MSQDIIFEVNFFLHSLMLGVIITFVYDWFLILRRCIRHSLMAISLEDMIFWIACAIGVFYMLHEENNGILRWFAVLGAAIGMIIYKKLVSSLFVKIMSTIIIKVFNFFWRPLAFVFRKLKQLFAFISRKVSKLAKLCKKKLTIQMKLIKMILCKRKDQKNRKERNYGKKSGLPQKASE